MTLRVGLVGCGLVARRYHLPAFQRCEEATVVAVASGRVESAKAAAEQFGVPRVHARWQDLAGDPDVDAVDVCAVNALHADISIAAARAGKHVLVEKPMAVTVAEADAMIAAARQAGVVLMVAHNLRFVPAFEELRRIVESGALGRLYVARGVFMHAGPDEAWGATSDWFWRQDTAGGGSLIDLGVHIVDLLRWFVGRRVLEVAAMTSRVEKPTYADDNAMLVLRFEGDVLATVQTGWTARPAADTEIVIHGERGHVAFSRAFKRPLAVRLAGGETTEPEIPAVSERVNPYVHFARSVRDRTPPLTSGEEGRATLAVVEAAYESARTGQAVVPRQ